MNIQIGDLIYFKRSDVLCTIIDTHINEFTGGTSFKFQSIGYSPITSIIEEKSIIYQIKNNNITHYPAKK